MTNKEFDIAIQQQLQTYSAPVPAGLWEKIAAQDLANPKDPFDDFIQDKLYHHIAPVPAGLWDRIKPAEDNKRRRIIGWFPQKYWAAAAILLFLLGGSIAAYFYLGRPAFEQPKIEQSTIEQLNKEQSNAEQSVNNQTIIEPSGKQNVSKDPLLNEPNNQGANSQISGAADASAAKSIASTTQSIAPIKESKQTPNNLMASANRETVSETSSNASSESAYTLALKVGNAYVQKRRNLSALFNGEMNQYHHATSFKNVVICPTDRKMRNPDWDVEVFVSPDIPFKTVTSNNTSPQLLSRKDSSESLRPGFSAGIRLVKPLTDNFALKTGIHYTQINEPFTYRTENESRTTTVVSVRAIIRAPGDTLIVRDTSTLTQIGFKTNTVKNRYRSVDIPVLASYQWGNDDLRFGITAGLIVNVSSWYQGVMLDSSLSAVTLGKENNMIYKKNIGLGLYAGINITKRINYATQLFFEPYFRYNLSNMTQPNAPFNQRFSIGGLAVGLRFNLNDR